MNKTIGTCSVCGGPVQLPDNWMGTQPPIPTCASCGATKKRPHGRVIDMVPSRRQPDPRGGHDPAGKAPGER